MIFKNLSNNVQKNDLPLSNHLIFSFLHMLSGIFQKLYKELTNFK